MIKLNLFSAYEMRARIWPAVIAVAPAIAMALSIVVWSGNYILQLISGIVTLALLFAFGDLGRRFGRKFEQHIYAEMGGMPSITLLRYSDPSFDEQTKRRYIGFIAKALKETPPTPKDELSNLAVNDDFYRRCGTWLRENTRNTRKFSLLFGENITYGFRRNLYGLRWLGLAVNATVVIFALLHLVTDGWWRISRENITAMIFVLVIAAIHAMYLLAFVTRESVKEGARQYARQLILSTEQLMAKSK